MIIIIHKNGDVQSREDCKVAQRGNKIWINYYTYNIYAECLAEYDDEMIACNVMYRFRQNCLNGKNVLEL